MGELTNTEKNMAGKVTAKQRLNRILHYREFRTYKYVWKRLCDGNHNHITLSLPYFIKKFGDL